MWRDRDCRIWNVAVNLRSEERDPDAGAASWVGAAGFDRADALRRAAGEAVERFALRPSAHDQGVAALIPAFHPGRLRLSEWRVARGPASVDSVESWCLPAFEAKCGSRDSIWIPTVSVDDLGDARAVGSGCDSTPSGAASGPTLRFAVRSALVESIERDAIQSAWSLRPRLKMLATPDALGLFAALGGEARHCGEVIAEQCLEVYVVFIPTRITNTPTFLSLVIDREKHIVAAGAAAGVWSSAVGRAVRESIQVLALLRNVAASSADVGDVAAVRQELDRARFWCSEGSVDAAEGWLARMCQSPLEGWCAELERGRAPSGATIEELCHDLVLDGLHPVVCNLSHRIPTEWRERGWRAVKSVVIGHQVLRMDETFGFSFNFDRLDRLSSSWGDVAPALETPHPFI